MRSVFLISILITSVLMLIASALMAVKLIKDKESITNPYLILAVITFLIALRMVCWMIGL